MVGLVGKTVLTPKPVQLGTVLGVAVSDYVSAVAAADNEDLTQLVVGEILPVTFDICVAGFQYHVAAFAIVDRVENCLVAFVYPALSQRLGNRLLIN
jgi:hypothetical protein